MQQKRTTGKSSGPDRRARAAKREYAGLKENKRRGAMIEGVQGKGQLFGKDGAGRGCAYWQGRCRRKNEKREGGRILADRGTGSGML